MITDCHVHPPGGNSATLITRAEAFGIHRQCIFALGNEVDPSHPAPDGGYWPTTGAPHHTEAWNPPPERVTASNGLVQAMVEESPDRLCGLCFVNPRHTGHALTEIRNRVQHGPMLGIKLWISCKANDPLVEPLAELAVELDVPILQHCWNKFGGNLPGESTTADVAELAGKFPKLKIIAPHLSGQHEDGVLDLAPHPNVFLDTSGMLPDAGILEFALETVGMDRILFGSDAPLRHQGSALARIQGSGLSPAQRTAILHDNFRRIFAE